MNLIIDIGNTRVKLAVFQDESILQEYTCQLIELPEFISKVIKEHAIGKGILSSVVSLDAEMKSKLDGVMDLHYLSPESKVSFKNLYKTPKTLGLDRIALIAAAHKNFPNKNCLIIDAGTCITFDFIDQKGLYHGGAISPGLHMRYNALSKFTSKLPLLTSIDEYQLVGNDTDSSIHSGVLNGVISEIDGVIDQYHINYEDLTVVLTGGDVNFLSKQLKNTIFATQNFLLQGLNSILNYNNL